jgi:hypothetical protein
MAASSIFLDDMPAGGVGATLEACVVQQLKQGNLIACCSIPVILLACPPPVPLTPARDEQESQLDGTSIPDADRIECGMKNPEQPSALEPAVVVHEKQKKELQNAC